MDIREHRTKRVLVIFGTRPEAIKMAPVIHGLHAFAPLEPLVAVTAQHRRMLDDVLEAFSIEPDFDLDLIEERQDLAALMSRALCGLAKIIETERPDLVLVQGDTATTVAGALAAFYRRVPVVHVEAGLRTHDAMVPFPEERNRRLTAQVTDLHLAPTVSSRLNLLAEGVDPDRVVVTGNTVIDALSHALSLQTSYAEPALRELDRDPRRVLLVTAHRRESWARLGDIGHALAEIARGDPDLLVVLPAHRNPVVRESLLPAVSQSANVLVVEPLPYPTFVRLMVRADAILTDSGGIQEEGPALGKRVLVMRDVTERHEATTGRAVRLVGTSASGIVRAVRALFETERVPHTIDPLQGPYGDGQAARRCVAAIANLLGLGPRADEFSAQPQLIAGAAR